MPGAPDPDRTERAEPVWVYDTALDLEQSPAERLRRFPRQPDMLVYGLRWLAALVMRWWLRTYHRLRISGRENVPRGRSMVLVANHASHLDALCLLAALPLRRIHRTFPAAASDYFFTSLPRVALAATVVNALPFGRKSSVRGSLALCRQLLESPENTLILFPEGTRSVTGEMGAFRPGVGLVVAGTDVPVLPCYIAGAHRAWPKGAGFPRPRPVRLVVGRPRTFAHAERKPQDAARIAAQLQSDVQALAEAAGPRKHRRRGPGASAASSPRPPHGDTSP